MKKIIPILILVFAFTFTAEAQKKEGKPSAEKRLTQMTEDLGLTLEQQNKIKPLLVTEIADKQAMMVKRKELKDAGEKLSKKDAKKMKKEKTEKQLVLTSQMKSILTEEQFIKFEEASKRLKEKKPIKKEKKNKL
jgi:hypothetical protein